MNDCSALSSVREPKIFWIDNLCKYKTIADLRRSSFFSSCGPEIESFLQTPQVIPFPGAVPRLSSFLRVVQWNIEKGKRLDAIEDRLRSDEKLRWADIVILNEADLGMNRSQNRHVARALAESLEMNAIFAPAHFELTKGTEDELILEGENRESLQGNAILTRYPIIDACVVPLPVSFEPYEFYEKRFGSRNCLWVRLKLRGSSLWVGSVHLELRNTPRCRARQMRHLLEHLPGDKSEAYLLGGDLNVNTFPRGTAWRTARSVARLVLASPDKIKRQLLHPECGKEPLFNILKQHGFAWEMLNSNEETARVGIHSLEEADFLPSSVLEMLRARLDPYQGYLCFKLDWLFGKNLPALAEEQKKDMRANEASRKPSCIKGENTGPLRISDHLPIYADLDLA
jgi:endonuclease/exonuclease/phosphatase family metal-dependent hydrolase